MCAAPFGHGSPDDTGKGNWVVATVGGHWGYQPDLTPHGRFPISVGGDHWGYRQTWPELARVKTFAQSENGLWHEQELQCK